MTAITEKTYLGDGVYSYIDHHQIWLYTSDGISNSRPIAIDPSTMANLIHFSAKAYGSEFIAREARRYKDRVE